ncbi:MAG: orotate phosphoribosyltransferase [Balneolaceae bacterium]
MTTHSIPDIDFARELAKSLLDINAVVLRPDDPFTWSSGWNSPIYCDNRLTLRYPKLRQSITARIQQVVEAEEFAPDVITGTATAGIPHASWVAQQLQLPLCYVRAKAKAHGMGNQIEGGIQKGEKTVVIEDLVSTGGSAYSVVEALTFIGADVQAIVSIFSYGFDLAAQKFDKLNIPLFTLTDYTTLVDVALETGRIKEEHIQLLNQWRSAPEQWPD